MQVPHWFDGNSVVLFLCVMCIISFKIPFSLQIFVPEDLKDDKYWCRRRKNNVAAKRSRDARRIKENQIALRAAYLESEINAYKVELEKMKQENKSLKSRLAKYES